MRILFTWVASNALFMLNIQRCPSVFCHLRSNMHPPHNCWPPTLSNQHKADLAQAHYSLEDILEIDTNWAKASCHARLICFKCSTPDHKAINCPISSTQSFDHVGDSQRNQITPTSIPQLWPPFPTNSVRDAPLDANRVAFTVIWLGSVSND